MGNNKGSRRRFGAVRQYRSGRWTASYLGTNGQEHRSPGTFATKTDAKSGCRRLRPTSVVATGATRMPVR